jgi:hypothetical protein
VGVSAGAGVGVGGGGAEETFSQEYRTKDGLLDTRKVGVRIVDWRFSLRVDVLRVSLVAQVFFFLLLVSYGTRCVGVLMHMR